MNPDLIAALNPPRLPAGFVATGWADLLAAFGIGLWVAALAVTLIAPLFRPRQRPVSHAARLAATRALAPEERLLALSQLLHDAGASLPPDLRSALYDRRPYDPARAEALVRAAWAARGKDLRIPSATPRAGAGHG